MGLPQQGPGLSTEALALVSIDRLSLRFSNPILESELRAKSFRDTGDIMLVGIGSVSGSIALFYVAWPNLRPLWFLGYGDTFVLLSHAFIRSRLSFTESSSSDMQRVILIFSWASCIVNVTYNMLFLLCGGCLLFREATELPPAGNPFGSPGDYSSYLTSPYTTFFPPYVALLAMMHRKIVPDLLPRLLTVTFLTMRHTWMIPVISHAARVQLIAIACIGTEVVGYILERSRRRHFLDWRRRLAEYAEYGQPRIAQLEREMERLDYELRMLRKAISSDPISSDPSRGSDSQEEHPPLLSIHPITMCFSDSAVEERYLDAVFSASCRAAIVQHVLNTVLCVTTTAFHPATLMACLTANIMSSMHTGAKVWLDSRVESGSMHGARARLIYGWGNFTLLLIMCLVFIALQKKYELIAPNQLTEGSVLAVALINLMYMVWLSSSGVSRTPVVLVMVCSVMSNLNLTPNPSPLSRNEQALLILASVLSGVMIGHVLDASRRQMYILKYYSRPGGDSAASGMASACSGSADSRDGPPRPSLRQRAASDPGAASVAPVSSHPSEPASDPVHPLVPLQRADGYPDAASDPGADIGAGADSETGTDAWKEPGRSARSDPLTLRFADRALEREYRAQAFAESSGGVAAITAVGLLLFGWLSLISPETLPPFSACVGILLWGVAGSFQLQMSEPHRAIATASWMVMGINSLTSLILTEQLLPPLPAGLPPGTRDLHQSVRQFITRGLPPEVSGLWCTAAFWITSNLCQRRAALLNWPRILTPACCAILFQCNLYGNSPPVPPWSFRWVGRADGSIFISSAIVCSGIEVLGSVLEMTWRQAFLQRWQLRAFERERYAHLVSEKAKLEKERRRLTPKPGDLGAQSAHRWHRADGSNSDCSYSTNSTTGGVAVGHLVESLHLGASARSEQLRTAVLGEQPRAADGMSEGSATACSERTDASRVGERSESRSETPSVASSTAGRGSQVSIAGTTWTGGGFAVNREEKSSTAPSSTSGNSPLGERQGAELGGGTWEAALGAYVDAAGERSEEAALGAYVDAAL